MSCSIAIPSSPVFSPSTRVPLSCKGSSETLALTLSRPDVFSSPPAPSPPAAAACSASPLRPRFLLESSLSPATDLPSSCLGTRRGGGGSLLKRKRPCRIDIPLQDEACFVNSLNSDGRKELEEESEGFAVYCKRGKKRLEMEDRHVAKLDLCGDPKMAFFGVFDGHGGKTAAKFASEKLGPLIAEEIQKTDTDKKFEIEEAISNGYKKTDREFLKENKPGGTCCVTALIRKGNMVISNAGDCRAVLCKEGKAEALTSDHRFCREDERNRIENLGGFVHYCNGAWRLQASLAVSRGIGDSNFKQWVIADPESKTLEIIPQLEFLILASDGLWDKVSDQEAVDVARPLCISDDKSSALSACKRLADLAVSRGSADDVSIMIIRLSHFVT